MEGDEAEYETGGRQTLKKQNARKIKNIVNDFFMMEYF